MAAMKVQGGRMVPVDGATKARRNAQLNRLMDQLRKAREGVFKESQKLTDFNVSSEDWNAHLAEMRKFYAGIDAVYNNAARMLHSQ